MEKNDQPTTPRKPETRQVLQTAPQGTPAAPGSLATIADSQEEADLGNEGSSATPRRSGRAKLSVARYAPEGDILGSRELADGDGDGEEEVMRIPPFKSPAARPRKAPQGHRW